MHKTKNGNGDIKNSPAVFLFYFFTLRIEGKIYFILYNFLFLCYNIIKSINRIFKDSIKKYFFMKEIKNEYLLL